MSVELLEKELHSLLKPISDQLVYYSQALKEIRKLIYEYFTSTEWAKLIVEEARVLSPDFQMEIIYTALSTCLVEEEQLRAVLLPISASSKQQGTLAQALDHQVKIFEMPFSLTEAGHYEIRPSTNCPPQLLSYLKQLTQALTLYRYGLEFKDAYEQLMQCHCFDLSDYKRFERNLASFQQEMVSALPESVEDLMRLYRLARSLKAEINKFFNKAHGGMEEFTQSVSCTRLALDAARAESVSYLEKAYQEISIKGVIAIYRDDRFQPLLRALAKQLYANKYNYSYLSGKIWVFKTPHESNRREMEQCLGAIPIKWPLAKIRSVESACRQVNELLLAIKVKAAELNIDLSSVNKSALMRESIFKRYLPAAISLNSRTLAVASSSQTP